VPFCETPCIIKSLKTRFRLITLIILINCRESTNNAYYLIHLKCTYDNDMIHTLSYHPVQM